MEINIPWQYVLSDSREPKSKLNPARSLGRTISCNMEVIGMVVRVLQLWKELHGGPVFVIL